MPILHLIILVFAFVLAVLASFGINLPKFQFGWGAFALFLLYLLVGGLTR